MVHYQGFAGSSLNYVEIATGWHKPQERLSPVDLYTSQTVGDTLQHLELGVTPFDKAIGGVIIKVMWLTNYISYGIVN